MGRSSVGLGLDSATPTERRGRLDSLDGLRGVAALVVVFHHTLLVVPSLAEPYRNITKTRFGSRAWWAVYTPLHLLWGGGEAVYLFFVLSGFVLARPYLFRRASSWTPYYAKRLVRLYIPTLGALVVAGICRALVRRRGFDGGSWWLLARQVPITFKGVVNDALLIFDPGTLTGVLWSLRWEVLFSMLLPMFVAVAQMAARSWASLVIISVGFVMLGSRLLGLPANLFFLPLFGFGVLLASRESTIRRMSSHRVMVRPFWWLAAILCAVLMTSRWIVLWAVAAWPEQQKVRAGFVGDLAVGLGCLMAVTLALVAPPLQRALTSRILRWLGSRSFSLYLVHEPIVVSAAYLAHGWNPASAAGGVLTALVVAELFYRTVERPSIGWSRRAEARSSAVVNSVATA